MKCVLLIKCGFSGNYSGFTSPTSATRCAPVHGHAATPLAVSVAAVGCVRGRAFECVLVTLSGPPYQSSQRLLRRLKNESQKLNTHVGNRWLLRKRGVRPSYL